MDSRVYDVQGSICFEEARQTQQRITLEELYKKNKIDEKLAFGVLKIGGSVLKNGESYRNVAQYVMNKTLKNKILVFPSAFSNVTDTLIEISENKLNENVVSNKLKELNEMYSFIIKTYLPSELSFSAKREIENELNFVNIYTKIGNDDVIRGSGEKQSSILLKYFIKSLGMNAECAFEPHRAFSINKNRSINMEFTRDSLKRMMEGLDQSKVIVIPGYLGRSVEDNKYKTGTRNSTDAFAAAAADVINADLFEIIKDVPGVYRIDPLYGDFGILDNLSYDEAGKMSWRGSPVVHPEAIKIARKSGKPIIVKNLQSKGTYISEKSQTTKEKPVAAITVGYHPTISIVDDTMDLQESIGYLNAVTDFVKDKEYNIGVDASDFRKISYSINLQNKKKKQTPEELLNEHVNELREHLISKGYEPDSVNGDIIGTVTLVGDSMQRRSGTLEEIFSTVSKTGTSVRIAVQSDEKYSPPSITFGVDSNKLEVVVKELCKKLFS